MIKLSNIFLILILLICSQKAYSLKSTVPGEGGYGTIEYEGVIITGTFNSKYDWCRDCVYRIPNERIRIEGNFAKKQIKKNGWDLVPKDNEAIFYDEERDLIFTGRFKVKYGEGWDFGSGLIEYKGKKYSSNTYGYWEAGEEVLEKYNEEIIAENNKALELEKKKKEKERRENEPFYGYDDNDIIPAATGSGFFISNDGKVVSNFHVVDSCDTLKIFYNGKEYRADTIAQDTINDLSLLVTSAKPSIYYNISENNVGLLEDVIVAGFPLGKKVSSSIKTSRGSVTSLSGYGDNFSNFQIDAALNQGNSGGPIIDNYGNVVGVAVSKYGMEEGVESFNFGIKSSVLRNFLESNSIKYSKGKNIELERTELAKLITSSTVFIECWMTVEKIKLIISYEDNTKAMLPLN